MSSRQTLTERAQSAVLVSWGLCDPPTRRHAQVSRPVSYEGAPMSSYNSISSDKLVRLIGTANTPVLIDVRTDEHFAADPRLIPGALRRAHEDVASWADSLAGRSAIVICKFGGKLAEGT